MIDMKPDLNFCPLLMSGRIQEIGFPRNRKA